MMTPTNWFRNYIHGIRQWYFLTVLWYCVHSCASCPSGTFKSDFLSGGCAVCPKELKYCENEEYEDSVRCFKACSKLRRILSTIPPTLHPTSKLPKTLTSPPRTPTQATEIIRKTIVFEKFTNVFNKTLFFPTHGHSSDERSGRHNWTEITVGIAVSVVALILVLGIFIALVCWRERSTAHARSNGDQRRQNIDYSHVRPDSRSRSNSDQVISDTGETLENTDEAVDVENIGSSLTMSSVSHEDFGNMPESQV